VAADLSKKIGEMDKDAAERAEVLARQAQSNRRVIRWLVAIVAFLVVLSTLVAVALIGVRSNTHRLDVTATVSRQKALCPLYQVLVDADTAHARERAVDKSAYDRAYNAIHEGYTALNCKEFKGSAPKLG
jgi:hypothetical protein